MLGLKTSKLIGKETMNGFGGDFNESALFSVFHFTPERVCSQANASLAIEPH